MNDRTSGITYFLFQQFTDPLGAGRWNIPENLWVRSSELH